MRALPLGLMVLGLMGIAVVGICGGDEEVEKEIIAQERSAKETAPPATSMNKVVIGVLDFEITVGGASKSYSSREHKKALMRELRRNTRVKLVDIRESSSLSDLKYYGYEGAERYKNPYQLDMILHIYCVAPFFYGDDWKYYFSFIDLYTKTTKEVSFEFPKGISTELSFRGIFRKVLVSQDLNRVLRAKKKVLAKKEVAVPPEVKESPKQPTKAIVPPETSPAKLTETYVQLEEMKKELEEERERLDLLTKELAKRKMREEDLLSRLEHRKEIPPVILVASPKDDTEVEVDTITFFGVAEDDQGIKGLEIFINDNPLVTKAGRDLKVVETKYPRRLEFSERIPLQRGKNEIRIRAIDTDGLIAGKILTVRYRETRKNVWAVVIGIDKYQNTRHLQYAVNDARAFYDHLIRNNRIPQENITLMINEKARFNRLRSVLGTHLKNKAGKEDMVIIYFAGHGAFEKDVMSPDGDGLEKYILPYDANPKDLYGSALPMSEISRIFNRIRSERLIFIADACYSGASGGRTISLTGVRANMSDAFLDRIARGKGRIILTASGANEVSGEDDELRHGVFTYFLLEGLRGKADTDRDGMITVDEAYRYVSREVPRATGQEQHPVKKGIVEGQLILGIVE